MPHRRPVPRPLVVAGLIAAGLIAVVGGLALRGPGLVAVGVAGLLAACLGWGTARESTAPSRRSNTEAAILAAAWTIGVLLVLSGTSVLAGGVVAAVLTGCAAIVALGIWVVRTPKDSAGASRPASQPGPPAKPATPLSLVFRRDPAPTSASDAALPPVALRSTEDLGREWLESTAALAWRLDPPLRAAIVRRRQETLDELERRDPEGFQRWLATGPVLDRDPAPFVRYRRPLGESAAGSDAADAA